MLEAVKRRVSFRNEGDLESGWNPYSIECNHDVSSRELAMGILSDANDEHSGQFVLKSQARKRPVALLDFVRATVAHVGAHVLSGVIDFAIGMRPRQFHSGLSASVVPAAGEPPTDNYKIRVLENAMLASPQYSFEPWAIKGAPDDPGLYALYRGGELICIGVAKGSTAQDTIRARLIALFEDPRNVGTITHYKWEITSKPHLKRELYLKQLGRAPADCEQLPSSGGHGTASSG